MNRKIIMPLAMKPIVERAGYVPAVRVENLVRGRMLRLGHAAHQGSDRGGPLSAGSAGLQGQLRPTTMGSQHDKKISASLSSSTE